MYDPTAVAYDWIHDLLYWTEAGTHSISAKIEVLTVSTKWRRTLIAAPDVDSPTTLIVDPRDDQRSVVTLYFHELMSDRAPIQCGHCWTGSPTVLPDTFNTY